MALNAPEDAMPWVGLYVGVASLVCTLAMAGDAFLGFRQRKIWFPCRFFTLNAASLTVIAITMKLPVDLTTIKPENDDLNVKYISMGFLITTLANFLPSLGLMNDKELLVNLVALGILVITIIVNVSIQIFTRVLSGSLILNLLLIFPLLWVFSVALTVPASRKHLDHQYKELHILALNRQEIKFSSKELKHHVKKYWMMAETSNPQFAIACSQVSFAFGVISLPIVIFSSYNSVSEYLHPSDFSYGQSDYKWSIKVILNMQSIGVVVGSIAPICRCFTAIIYFNLSTKWSKNHLNVFRVEKHWVRRLQHWKRSHVHSHIPGRLCKKVFHNVKNTILNFCIALQISVVVICKLICLIPRSCLIFLCYCWYLFKLLLMRFKKDPNASNNNMNSAVEEYSRYVLQIEEQGKLSKRVLENMLRSISNLLRESEEKEPGNLLKLLEKSSGFNGVVEFDNDQVPLLHPEETQYCWSLVAVTLTAVAIALPNIANTDFKELLTGVWEGLQIVRRVEETLNVNGDLVETRKAARRLWTEVHVYGKWLQTDLQKRARKGNTLQEILQWLGDEAIKNVIKIKSRKKVSLNHSLHKLIASSSMYRISQTVLLHCKEQENWPKDEELFEWISTTIADLLLACFTNLPRVILMKCHHSKIEKRVESIRAAAQLLGKSKKILKILKARQLPNLDVDSMAYIDKWHALTKNEIPDGTSSNRIQPASSKSLVVTIV